MKKLLIILSISSLAAFFTGCNSNPSKEDFSTKEETTETPAATTTENGNPSYDPKEEKVNLQSGTGCHTGCSYGHFR